MSGRFDLGDLFLALLYLNLVGAVVAALFGHTDAALLFVTGIITAAVTNLCWELGQ